MSFLRSLSISTVALALALTVVDAHAEDIEVTWGKAKQNPDGSAEASVELQRRRERVATRPEPSTSSSGATSRPAGSGDGDATVVIPRSEISLLRESLRKGYRGRLGFESDESGYRPGRGRFVIAPEPELTPAPPPATATAVTPRPSASARSQVSLDELVRLAVANAAIPSPDLRVGPDPSRNEWHMIPVGFPVWAWVANGGERTGQARLDDVGVTLTARAATLSVYPGDGQQIVCESTTDFYAAGGVSGRPSPTCGYRHTTVPPGKRAHVQALQEWVIRYETTDGRRGSTSVLTRGSLAYDVDNLRAILVPGAGN